jgi:hypothetical protein
MDVIYALLITRADALDAAVIAAGGLNPENPTPFRTGFEDELAAPMGREKQDLDRLARFLKGG